MRTVAYRAALAGAVAVLVIGAAFLASSTGGGGARAEQLVMELYEGADAAAVMDRLVEGSIGAEQLPQLEAGLQQVLAQGGEVSDVTVHEVRGTEVSRVVVTGPTGGVAELEWCVLPEGELLLGCRVGGALVDAQADPDELQVVFAGVSVYPDNLLVSIAVTTTGGEAIPLDGLDLQVPDAADEVTTTRTAYVGVGGQQQPADPDALEINPESALLIDHEVASDDLAAVAQGPFTLSWDGGSIELQVTDVTWLVGEDAPA